MGFQSIIGQSDAINCLLTAYRKGRMAHAYLFYGTGGTGKESTAIAFAKWLNCDRRSETDSCGHCPSCRKIASHNHADIKLVFPRPATLKTEEVQELVRQKAANPDKPLRFDKNVSIVVDDIREVQKQLIYPPYEAKVRVIIIREVEKMNVVTSNALLKTLEEPPDRTLLLLTSNYIHALMPTIRSRCQQVRFRNLHPDEIEQALIARESLPSTLARLLGHLANGSLGEVIGVEEADLFAQRQAAVDMINTLLQNQTLSLLARVDEWLKAKQNLDHQLKILSILYRDLLLCNSQIDGARYITNGDLMEQLRPAAAKLRFEAVERSLHAIDETRLNLSRTNVNPQLALLQLFFSLRGAFTS